jgi:hypothetical protein
MIKKYFFYFKDFKNIDHTTWSDVTQTIPYLYNRLNATYSKTYVCHMFLFLRGNFSENICFLRFWTK